MTGRVDWPALMQAGVFGLRLRPAEFWSLTPAELTLLLGRAGRAGGPMTRRGLNDLVRAWPDVATSTEGQGDGRE